MVGVEGNGEKSGIAVDAHTGREFGQKQFSAVEPGLHSEFESLGFFWLIRVHVTKVHNV